MKMEPLRGGSLKIWMTDADMRQWGLTFERMSARDIPTQQALLRLITVARERKVLLSSSDIAVEALPIDGGCLFLLTPLHTAALTRVPEPTVYTVHTADDLLNFSSGLSRIETEALPSASLFGWQMHYRLIIYADKPLPAVCRRLVEEFCDKTAKGRAATAHTEEHGRALLVGNALHRLQLTARGSREPKQRDRPH